MAKPMLTLLFLALKNPMMCEHRPCSVCSGASAVESDLLDHLSSHLRMSDILPENFKRKAQGCTDVAKNIIS
jgi:hypothetical protein